MVCCVDPTHYVDNAEFPRQSKPFKKLENNREHKDEPARFLDKGKYETIKKTRQAISSLDSTTAAVVPLQTKFGSARSPRAIYLRAEGGR